MRNSLQTLGGVITHSYNGKNKSVNIGQGIQPLNALSPQGGLEPGHMAEEEEDYYEEEDDGRTPGPGQYFNP